MPIELRLFISLSVICVYWLHKLLDYSPRYKHDCIWRLSVFILCPYSCTAKIYITYIQQLQQCHYVTFLKPLTKMTSTFVELHTASLNRLYLTNLRQFSGQQATEVCAVYFCQTVVAIVLFISVCVCDVGGLSYMQSAIHCVYLLSSILQTLIQNSWSLLSASDRSSQNINV